MKAWKLTDEKDQTRGSTQWGEGVTHAPKRVGSSELCTDGWIHYYRHPILAAILNPIHAAFDPDTMHLWECEAEGKHLHEGWLKSGCTKLTTLHRVPLPEVSTEKRVEFAIRCAVRCLDPQRTMKTEWELWAESWLNGSDRSAGAAYAVAYAAYAAYAAVHAAADAADAAARAAARAADAAARAAYAVPELDLIAVLRECGLCE